MTRDFGQRGGFEAELHTAAGDFLHRGDRIVLSGIDRVRRADFLGKRQP